MTKWNFIFAIIFVLKVFILSNTASAQGWRWAKQGSGMGADQVGTTAIDKSGNVYTVGVFRGTSINFGPYTLSNAGSADVFVVKYDMNGNVLWAKSAGGDGVDGATSIATDNSGNTYITGFFSSATLSIGTITLFNANGGSGSSGLPSTFLIKIDSFGTPLWGKATTGTQNNSGRSVTTDIFNNVYVAGVYYQDSILIGTSKLPNSGNFDIFIVKYDSSGNFIWAKNAGSVKEDVINYITVDSACNIYATGYYTASTIFFGGVSLNTIGLSDIFLAKYDSSGICMWARKMGGSGSEEPTCITTNTHDVYITGNFFSPSITLGTSTHTNAGAFDIFCAKYDTAGNFKWAKTFGNTGSESINSIAMDTKGNTYMAGEFSSNSVSFDTNTVTNSNASMGPDIFLTKCDSSGNILWAQQLGNEYGETAFSLSVDKFSGSLYMNGTFRSSTFQIGSFTLTNTEVSNTDVYLTKLDQTLLDAQILAENDETLLLYPNPSNNIIVISSLKREYSYLIIYDYIGNALARIDASGKLYEKVDISEYKPGMYLLKAISPYQCKTITFQIN